MKGCKMEHLIFAFQAVAPTISIVIFGVFLRRKGFLTEELVSKGNRLCFEILFPILVFFNLYDSPGIDVQYLKIILFCVGVICVSVPILFLLIPRLVQDNRKIPVLIQSIYRGNFMLYGLPFSRILGGDLSVSMATSIMAVTLPILNVVGALVFSYFSENAEKPDIWSVFKKAVTNPIFTCVIFGLIFYFLEIPIPDFLHTAGTDLSGIATPLAFLFLGGQFTFHSGRKNWKLLCASVFAKLVLMPCIFLPIAIGVFGISGYELIPVFIFVSAPTAITNYQWSLQFGADDELARDFLVYSMIASAFTMFLLIYFLRSQGLII